MQNIYYYLKGIFEEPFMLFITLTNTISTCLNLSALGWGGGGNTKKKFVGKSINQSIKFIHCKKHKKNITNIVKLKKINNM